MVKKIAIVVSKTFANTNNPFVEFGIILAQHKIVVRFYKFRPSLYGTKFPWPCTQFCVEEQLQHWISKVIGRQLHWSHFEFEEYTFITADAIQKIYSKHPLLEVPFLAKTKYTKLVEHYTKEFKTEIRAQREQQELAQWEAEWWDDLRGEEADNIENDMDN